MPRGKPIRSYRFNEVGIEVLDQSPAKTPLFALSSKVWNQDPAEMLLTATELFAIAAVIAEEMRLNPVLPQAYPPSYVQWVEQRIVSSVVTHDA